MKAGYGGQEDGNKNVGRTDCRRQYRKMQLCVKLFSMLMWSSISSIQFYLYSAFNKGAFSQSCFTENCPPMSKPRATVARKNSLADNRKKP